MKSAIVILYCVACAAVIAFGIYMTICIVQSDLPLWLKFALLK